MEPQAGSFSITQLSFTHVFVWTAAPCAAGGVPSHPPAHSRGLVHALWVPSCKTRLH